MTEGLFARGAIPVLRAGMAFAQDRQRELVNNIANISNPDYVASDLPVEGFREALASAVSERDRHAHRFLEVRGEGISPRPGGTYAVESVRAGGNLARHDGNTVSTEQQMSRLMENTLWHNGLAQMLTQQYNLVATAIRGRV